MPVAVVADTTHYLPPELVAGNEIHEVSLYVTRGGDATAEAAITDYDAFYGALRDASDLPTTSQPSPGDFLAVYEPLIEDGADPDAMDRNNLTPLDFAMVRIPKGFNEVHPQPREEMAALLRSLGAKLEHPDLPAWPPASTPRITARVPSDTTVLPPF